MVGAGIVYTAQEARNHLCRVLIDQINTEIKKACDEGKSSVVFHFNDSCTLGTINTIKDLYRQAGYEVSDEFNQDFPDDLMIDW